MRGPKIMNSINYLNQIAQSFNISTIYFRFGNKVDEVSSYSQSTLPCNDGTKIENCLNDLFNNHLRRFSGSKTKFIFVTDAEDRISNVSNVISNKQQCEAAYGNKLHSYCLLTGDGSCANELQQIFGGNAFDHCTDSKFKTILQKITGGVKTVNKISGVSMNVSNEISNLTKDNNADIRAFGNTMNDILTQVKQSETKRKEAQTKIDTVKTNLVNLNTQTTNVADTVSRAHTDTEIGAAEAAVNTLKKGYSAESNRLSDAGKLLDESADILRGETSRAEDISKQLEENGNKISTRATAVITNIIASIKELSEITHGSYEQVQELKSKFRTDLDDLMEIVKENNSLQIELEQVKTSISGTFKSLKRGRVEYSQFKQEIQDNLSRLNQLLDDLDER